MPRPPMAQGTYYATHREALLEKKRQRYAADPDHFNAITKKHKEAHPDRIQARSAAYYAINGEKIRLYNKARYVRRREAIRAQQKQYQAANPDKMRMYGKQRHARKMGAAVNDFTAAQWRTLQAAYDHRCAYCHRRAKGHLTQDHITPLIHGGHHTLSNIVPACKSCNSRKGTRPPPCPVQPLLL